MLYCHRLERDSPLLTFVSPSWSDSSFSFYSQHRLQSLLLVQHQHPGSYLRHTKASLSFVRLETEKKIAYTSSVLGSTTIAMFVSFPSLLASQLATKFLLQTFPQPVAPLRESTLVASLRTRRADFHLFPFRRHEQSRRQPLF